MRASTATLFGMPDESIPAGDVTLALSDDGAGIPVVLLHGLTASRRYVVMGSQALQRGGHRVVAYDARGHGASSPAPAPDAYRYEELTDDLVAVLDALGIERAVLAGASMGAHTALRLALEQPERVAAIAVITPGYDVMIAPEYAADPANYALYAEVAVQYQAPIPVLMAQLQAIGGHDVSARLAGIQAPTLVVHGTADRLLESANGELLARLIPGARLELLEGAGHMFFWEQPERSAQLVREHVAAAARAF
jgi:pimeloyl-ACP methyl ester carboxylesterase